MPPRFDVYEAESAGAVRDELERTNPKKWKKINKAMALLAENPGHPGLAAHKWDSLEGRAPGGGDVWVAYIENRTPGAWRMFFYYDPKVRGRIIITRFEPHT